MRTSSAHPAHIQVETFRFLKQNCFVVTIKDVAHEAGVSISTVSYVLSGTRSVSAETKHKVKKAIKKLNYHPNAGARALASTRTNIVAMVAPLRAGVTMPVVLEFVSGVVTAAREYDYDVLLATQDDTEAIARLAGATLADGLIIMDIEYQDPRIAQLRRIKQPATLIGVPKNSKGMSCVDLDFYASGRLAVEHLTTLGHRNIGFIGAADPRIRDRASYALRTFAGLEDEAKATGAHIEVVGSDSSFAGGMETVQALLNKHPEITALIVHNEFALAGILDQLERLNFRIPNDISVLAIALESAYIGLARQVTAIKVPGYEMGRIALELTMERITNTEKPPETRLIAPTLTECGTTAPNTKKLSYLSQRRSG